MKKIAIIGSGLASISAAKVLVSRGVRPTIIDVGDTLNEEISEVVDNMARVNKTSWKLEDIKLIASNPTLDNTNKIPKKLSFGSDFFYGKKDQYQSIESDKEIPPISYAKGGFSVGWGASVLPPDDIDIESWPITNKDLEPYFKLVLSDLPYSAEDDDLSCEFPLYKEKVSALRLTSGNQKILNLLKNNKSIKYNKNILVGKSRLLTQVTSTSKTKSCQYCGLCTSGCVYGCIYKSSQDLDKMIKSNLVDYIPNTLVQSVSENAFGTVQLTTQVLENGLKEKFQFDKVLIGAGAVNSTRIILQSKKLYNQEVKLLSTVGFVAPIFSFKKIKMDWPNVNTQPGIFLEYRANMDSNWIHTQVSTPNEMVLSRLKVDIHKKNIIQWFKRRLI